MPEIPLEQIQGQATTILGKVSVVPKGNYENSTRYDRLDVVVYEGNGYIATRDNLQDIIPGETDDWMLIVQRGEQGKPGPVGPEGPPGPSGAEVEITEGMYVFAVEDGDLYLYYSGETAPDFGIDEQIGELYIDIEE